MKFDQLVLCVTIVALVVVLIWLVRQRRAKVDQSITYLCTHNRAAGIISAAVKYYTPMTERAEATMRASIVSPSNEGRIDAESQLDEVAVHWDFVDGQIAVLTKLDTINRKKLQRRDWDTIATRHTTWQTIQADIARIRKYHDALRVTYVRY